MRGISWLAANQLASQEGLCTMKYVSCFKNAIIFASNIPISILFSNTRLDRNIHLNTLISDTSLDRKFFFSALGPRIPPWIQIFFSSPCSQIPLLDPKIRFKILFLKYPSYIETFTSAPCFSNNPLDPNFHFSSLFLKYPLRSKRLPQHTVPQISL